MIHCRRERERETRLCRRRGRERGDGAIDEATAQRGEIRARSQVLTEALKSPTWHDIYSGSGVRVGLVFNPMQFF